MLKSSEISRRLKGKVPKELQVILETMAADQIALTQQLAELAMMLDQMANVLNELTNVAVNMKSAADMIRRKEGHVSSEAIVDAELKDNR